METVELTSLKKFKASTFSYDKDIKIMLLAFSDYIDSNEFYLTRSDECGREIESILPGSMLFSDYKMLFSKNINHGFSKNDSLKISLAEMLVSSCRSVNFKYANAIADQVFLQYEIKQQQVMSDINQWSYSKKALTISLYVIGGIVSILIMWLLANNIFPVYFDERIELLCCIALAGYLILFTVLFNKKILGAMYFKALFIQTILFMSVYMILYPLSLN